MTTIRLTGRDIDGEAASCTVGQMLLILDELALANSAARLVWYGADLAPAIGAFARYEPRLLARIGPIDALRALLQNVPFPQIDFGVFAAFEDGASPPSSAISAEDASGRKCANSALELVAFDDTYIEVMSDDDDIVRRLEARFPTRTVLNGASECDSSAR